MQPAFVYRDAAEMERRKRADGRGGRRNRRSFTGMQRKWNAGSGRTGGAGLPGARGQEGSGA
jgi:hypothetical protein